MSLLGHADADHPQTYFEELSVQIRGPESGTTADWGRWGHFLSPGTQQSHPGSCLQPGSPGQRPAGWSQVLGWGVWHLGVTQEDG